MSGIWGRSSGAPVIPLPVIRIFVFVLFSLNDISEELSSCKDNNSALEQCYETTHRTAATAVTMKSRLVLTFALFTPAILLCSAEINIG
jgi:glucan phosphoethanolaminetransferase (alkaline phosphatase superfamily)